MRRASIKGRILISVILVVLLITIITQSISSSVVGSTLTTDTQNYIRAKADAYAQEMNSFLEQESTKLSDIRTGLEYLGETDHSAVNDFIEKYYLENNETVLNYYVCFEYDKSVIAATRDEIDIDPTERSWWIDATEQQAMIYTSPYVDAATGQNIVSIAVPATIGGEYAVLLADITIDSLIDITNSISIGDGSYGMLLDADDNVIAHRNESYLFNGEQSTVATDIYQGIQTTELTIQVVNDYDGVERFVGFSELPLTGWKLGVTEDKSVVTGQVVRNVFLFSAVGVILLVLFSFVLGNLIRKMLMPMEKLKLFIRKNVIGEENCQQYTDEVKEISYLIEELEDKFIGTIHQTKAEADHILTSVQNTDGKIVTISNNITEISSVMEETGAQFQEQTESIQRADENCNVILDAVEELSQHAQQAASQAEVIIEKVNVMVPEILADKERAVQVTKTSKKELLAAIEQSEVITQIAAVSQAIRGISEQTNLLALNASIEAARAGEAGKGFAVVAEEIRKLSENTDQEINKIDEMVELITTAVQVLSGKSSDILEFIDSTVLLDYQRLEELANGYIKDANYYSEVSANIGATSQELSANVQGITSVLNGIAISQTDLNKGIQSVNESLMTITSNSEEVARETNAVVESAGSLTETVGQFRI